MRQIKVDGRIIAPIRGYVDWYDNGGGYFNLVFLDSQGEEVTIEGRCPEVGVTTDNDGNEIPYIYMGEATRAMRESA